MGTKLIGILILLAVALLLGCGQPTPPPVSPVAPVSPAPPTNLTTPSTPPDINPAPSPPPPADNNPQSAIVTEIKLLKIVSITTDAEGGSARPEIIATQDRVFVIYLGNISAGGSRTFSLKIFDREMEQVIAAKTLVATTTQHGGPTDIRVAADDRYLYAFYETNKPIAPNSGLTYLWGAKYALDDSFVKVVYTGEPIASSKPMAELQDGGELLDDPAPLVTPDSVFVVTRLKYPISTGGKTVYRVREFDKELLMRQQFDLDLSGIADGRGRVTSLLYYENTIYIALATTVSDRGVMESNDDGALSDIILVRLKADWEIDTLRSIQTLSSEPDDRENYVTGFRSDGRCFYLTYKQAAGSPPTGEQRAWLKAYDKDFNLVQSEKIKTTPWGPAGGEIRPSLEISGNRLFSGQSAGKGLGKGNAEVYVYEIK